MGSTRGTVAAGRGHGWGSGFGAAGASGFGAAGRGRDSGCGAAGCGQGWASGFVAAGRGRGRTVKKRDRERKEAIFIKDKGRFEYVGLSRVS